MRILHIIDSLSMGGAENVLVGLSLGQKENGHEVTIMPLVCQAQTIIRKRIEDNGIAVKPFFVKGSVYNPSLIFKISRVIKSFDIVHVHLFPAMYWVAIAKLISFSKVPLVYTEHSTNNRRRSNAFLVFIDRIIYKFGYKKIVACSDRVMDTFRVVFPGINKISRINNGINTELFHDAVPYTKKELLGVDDTVFLVTMVSRFMNMKRQDTIVEALSKLPNDVHVAFVGGKENDEGLLRVQRMAKDMNVYERTHFLFIRKDVPRILKTSDVIVLASDYEGLSLSSIEGMASGKPFVASDVDGLREVVGGAGVLFENKDSSDLARSIMNLKTQPDFYKTIATQCRARSIQYDVNTMIEQYQRVYDSILC